MVNDADAAILAAHCGQTAPSEGGVPEPSTVAVAPVRSGGAGRDASPGGVVVFCAADVWRGRPSASLADAGATRR